jgi:CotH protein/lamin tail-like protein
MPARRAAAALSALLLALSTAARGADTDMAIDEIFYHPSSDCQEEEFIELVNRGTGRVDLGGWEFLEGVPFRFPPGAFADPGEYIVVARNPAVLQSVFGPITRLYGPWGAWPLGDGRLASLSDDGEDIVLVNSAGEEVNRVEYNDKFPWPSSADGGGPSLEQIDLHLANDKAGNWRAAGDRGPRWQLYRTTGQAKDSTLRLSLTGGGAYLVDDVAVEPVAGGANLVANGGFEDPGGWVPGGNHSASARVSGDAHGGSAAMRIEATGPGSLTDAVLQQVPGLVLDGPVYALSFWARRIEPGVSLTVGFDGRSAGFDRSEDIGAVSPAGSSSYDAAADTYTVNGSGDDIWGSADAFRFVSGPLSGDGSIEAEVRWSASPNSWGKAGLMIRESAAPSSRHAMAILSRDFGLRLQFRSDTGGQSSDYAGPASAGPARLRLTRQGDTFIAEADLGGGFSEFSRTEIPMTSSTRIGIMVTAHQNGSLATGLFRQVASQGLKVMTPATEEGPAVSATPGLPNTQLADHAPPYIRKVAAQPPSPASSQAVAVEARVDDPDGVTAVTSVVLEYQAVAPGHYIRITDPEYYQNWTAVPMKDDGTGGDAEAGDGLYTALIPGMPNRTLVRYRISAVDAAGASTRAPFSDDECPNFAYFVYDGVPDYVARTRSAFGAVPHVHPASDLLDLPVYHLITVGGDLDECWYKVTDFNDSTFRWRGTFVFAGEVYDHVYYRLRGGVWRYVYPKRYMKIKFLHGHHFLGLDNFGVPDPKRRSRLNLNAVIGNPSAGLGIRGECGIYETLAFSIMRWMGVPAPRTTWVHYRIVRGESEAGADQYSGDFFGIYLDVEQPDSKFLESQGLPEGNLYKMEAGWSKEVSNCDPADDSDIRTFTTGLGSSGGNPGKAWVDRNVDVGEYLSYHAVVLMAQHYDISAGKNYYYYHQPDLDRWLVLPWDTDLTFNANYGGDGSDPFTGPVIGTNPATNGLQFKNRLREGVDLVFKEKRLFPIIDGYRKLIEGIVRADRDRWDNGAIPPYAPLAQRVSELKSWIHNRLTYLAGVSADSAIPAAPSITSPAPRAKLAPGALAFTSSNFSDAAGDTHARSQWIATRVALYDEEGLAGPPAAASLPLEVLTAEDELSPAWDSGATSTDLTSVVIPPEALDLTPGAIYRVRVRYQDQTQRWSHWSAAVEFEISAAGGFRRGDANADGQRDIADAIHILFFLFGGGADLACSKSADVDDSGALDLTDPVALLDFLFLEGAQPAEPFAACGPDPTADELLCVSFDPCGL